MALTFLLAPVQAIAEPEVRSQEYESGNLVIKNDAIQRPENLQISDAGAGSSRVAPQKNESKSTSGRHSIRTKSPVSEQTLRAFLSESESPLVAYAQLLSQSSYSSTIIGICWIEQHQCRSAPYNNYWGIMKPGGGLQHFATLEEGITAIDALLARYETKGKDTVEKMNCIYVQPCSSNWESTVIKIKTQLENLTP